MRWRLVGSLVAISTWSILALGLIGSTVTMASQGYESRSNQSGSAEAGGADRDLVIQLGIRLLQDAIQRHLDDLGPADSERKQNQQKAIELERVRLRNLIDQQLRDAKRLSDEIERKQRLRELNAERERLERLANFKETGSPYANPWQKGGLEDKRAKCIAWQIKEKKTDVDFARCLEDDGIIGVSDGVSNGFSSSRDVKPNVSNSVLAKRPIKNSSGQDINPATQELCVTVKALAPEHLNSLKPPAIKYSYKLFNTCNKSYTVRMITNAGWTGLTSVGAKGTPGNWFCTDGFRGNKDCRGGISGYTFQ